MRRMRSTRWSSRWTARLTRTAFRACAERGRRHALWKATCARKHAGLGRGMRIFYGPAPATPAAQWPFCAGQARESVGSRKGTGGSTERLGRLY
eukprot:3834230-Prymnesium_polylepis.1